MSDAFAGSGSGGSAKTSRATAAKANSGAKSAKKSKGGKTATPSPQTAKRPSKAAAVAALILAKPTAINGKPAWFASSYVESSQKWFDRKLFSR